MKQMNPVKKSFLLALATTVYVTLVSVFMIFLGQSVNGGGLSSIILGLLLLVVSAAICGSLIFGWPKYKIIKGEAKEGFKIL